MPAMSCVICDSPDRRPRHVLLEIASSWVTAGPVACLPGYVCVVSRRHVDEPFDLDDREAWWAECMVVARALSTELRPKKMNYEIHGNTVPHLHLHLFPRTADDPFVGRPIDGTAHLVTRSPAELGRLRGAISAAAHRYAIASTAGI